MSEKLLTISQEANSHKGCSQSSVSQGGNVSPRRQNASPLLHATHLYVPVIGTISPGL